MSRAALFARTGAATGLVAGVVAGAAALGVAAQRHAAHRILRREDPEAGEPFGELAGCGTTVVADDGTRLHVEVHEAEGAANDVTVVFLHAYAMSQHSWHYQRRDLEGYARLVFVDHRGHGRSGRGPDDAYTVERLGADLACVLDAVAPTGPVVLVGHSIGGMAALSLAAARPEWFGPRVQGVVLVATSADERGRNLLVPLPELIRRQVPGAAQLLARHPEVTGRAMQLSDDLVLVLTQHYGFGSDRVSPSVVALTRDMHMSTPLDVLGAFVPSFDTYDVTHALPVLAPVEVTLVGGTKDAVVDLSRSLAIVRDLPHADVRVLQQAGHMLPLERPDDVTAAVRDTVDRVRAHHAP
jgi:pimeloyl-ACP methyl ester carboxylesterase